MWPAPRADRARLGHCSTGWRRALPDLALVRGFCIGGGTELALACRYRIAVDEPGTKFSLPEVMLGIVPGWGGMLRLPAAHRRAGGARHDADRPRARCRRAKKLGWSTTCAAARLMREHAHAAVLSGAAAPLPFLQQRLLNGPLRGRWRQGAARKRGEARQPPSTTRRLTPSSTSGSTSAATRWPCPPTSVLARRAGEAPDHAPTCSASITCASAARLRQGCDELCSAAGHRVHVVGAGVMGGDIAAWCACAAFRHAAGQQSPSASRRPCGAPRSSSQRSSDSESRRCASPSTAWSPTSTGAGVRQADVIIEAIYENLDAKQALFARHRTARQTRRADRHQHLLACASRTSRRRCGSVALVGIHFFNPVAQMPLVEVVRGERQRPKRRAAAAAFVGALDKLPLPVASSRASWSMRCSAPTC
jgi:3-hydroxyacyl-CoA dehydrogenase/enoyl-CoA hydratase/3-hydroxybutyryl-CoA epimerase